MLEVWQDLARGRREDDARGEVLDGADQDGARPQVGIGHTTLQVETSEATACALAPDHVV
jgi:hypothetical protein